MVRHARSRRHVRCSKPATMITAGMHQRGATKSTLGSSIAVIIVIALLTAVPVGAQTPIPQLALWEANMRSYGQLACDLRVAGESAKFATAFARVGYSGDFGGSWFLTQLVGTAKARELYYTAEIVDARQALALGIVNRVVADEKLEDETLTLARKLAQGPRIALRYMKRNMNAAETQTLAQCLDLEAMHHTRTGFTEDHREAARAFVEKREPVFKGR